MFSFQIAFLIAVITTNTAPALGQIGAIYFDVLQQSQVWINLDPTGTEGGPKPLHLNFTLAFPGRELTHVPDAVTLRAQADCLASPGTLRKPLLTIVLDGSRSIRLTDAGRTFQFFATCSSEGSSDTVVTQIPFAMLQEISGAREVQVDGIGFTTHLTPGDLGALQTYVRQITGGVAVK